LQEDIFFKAIEGGYDKNFTYLIGCVQSKQLALIDCAAPFELIENSFEQAQKLGFKTINKIYLTHAHGDHVASLRQVHETYNPLVYAHKWEFNRIKNLTGIEIQNFIEHEETLEMGEERIKCFHTPGHQPSCICFLWRNKIFTGDTLFVEGCGRCTYAESNYEDQLSSLRFIANQLPDELEVYPGHNYGSIPASTIGREKKVNKYLIGLSDSQFNDEVKEHWMALRAGKIK